MIKKIILIVFLIQSFLLTGCGTDKNNSNKKSGEISSKSSENSGKDSYAPIKTDPSKYEDTDLDKLRQLNGGDIEIYNDPATNIPKNIIGKFSSLTIKSSEEALTALMGLRDIMKIEDDSFCCIDIDDDRPDLCVFTLCQLYKGIIVENGTFQIAADKNNGTPFSAEGRYQRGISIDTTPGISSDEGLKSFTLEKKQKVSGTSLVVYTLSDNSYVLCWKYNIKSKDIINNKVVYINAVNGEVVNNVSTIIN